MTQPTCNNTTLSFPFFLLRLLMGVVKGISAEDVSQLVNTTGVDLVLSDLLGSKKGGKCLHYFAILAHVFVSGLN